MTKRQRSTRVHATFRRDRRCCLRLRHGKALEAGYAVGNTAYLLLAHPVRLSYLIACGLIGDPVPPVMISGGPVKKNS